MNVKPFTAAVLAVACTAGAHAAVFNGASFASISNGVVGLNGFGRGAFRPTVDTFAPVLPSATALFFDTWNINVSGVPADLYRFDSMVVNAFGGAVFSLLTFNSFDAAGVRNTIAFNINAAGTQAVGSGTFTVLQQCPVQSCVWIDVFGTQPLGGGGYGGTTIATVVPEPASLALMALGLAAVAGVVTRRRRA